MMTKGKQTFTHWSLERDNQGLVWAYLNRQDMEVNTLNESVMLELDTLLDKVSIDKNAKALIIASKNKTGFIAGADITQFGAIKTFEQAKRIMDQGHDIFNKLADLEIPTIAMIEGFCVGGGLELALACRYRIAEDSRKTKLGLPEIKLGIQPGWGGSVRLPRLIGAPAAMGLILTGRVVPSKTAARMGFVDAAVPKRHLRRAAEQYALTQPKARQASFWQRLTDHAFIRPLLAWQMRRTVAKMASREHYPAPYAVIDNWLEHGVYSANALPAEANSICKLFLTDTCRHLVSVFFLQEKLKGLAKGLPHDIKHVHVIGGGTMGGDIAAWCAFRGLKVTLQDREAKFLAPALKRAHSLFKKKFKKDKYAYRQAMDQLIPDVAGLGVAKADVIIEAIFESLEAKQDLFREVEARAKKSAVLATNTSSIPLDEINRVLENPERLVGIHFFNPVAKMPLVEIVKGEQTSDDVVAKAKAFVGKIDRLPLPVKSRPGFLVNRVLMPYLMECVSLLEENYTGPAIDKAAKRFGMPMGPVELADTVGLDVCLSVAENLTSHFGGTIPKRLREMVEAGHLGRKTGKGFYTYKKGKPVKLKLKDSSEQEQTEIADRLIMRMVNEAAACLREGVVADTELLDAGMIFGTGFAPFRGGLASYAQSFNIGALEEKFTSLAAKYGERFQPDTGLDKLREK